MSAPAATVQAPTIRAEGIGFAYEPGRWVIRGLSLELARSEVLAILGPNGMGKTTLLRLLLGALKPAEGRLAVTGACAFVPQLFQVAFDFTVLEMVLMGRARRIGLFGAPGARDRAAALEALEQVGLAGRAQASFQALSGGQRQLAIIARALVAEAEVLVLDEPTSALDLRNQELVLDWIGRLSRGQGLTVVFTTHQPSHALAAADRALLMFGPEAFAFGPASDVLTEADLQRLYGVRLVRVRGESGGTPYESFAPVHGPAPPDQFPK